MVRLLKWFNTLNISQAFYIVLIQSILIYWYLRKSAVIEQYHIRQDILCYNATDFPFIKPYDYFYPEYNPEVVLVFVHVQKTGGSFVEAALTKHGVFGFPCHCHKKKFCNCEVNNRIWLFSR